jgi:hypothetical protein
MVVTGIVKMGVVIIILVGVVSIIPLGVVIGSMSID